MNRSMAEGQTAGRQTAVGQTIRTAPALVLADALRDSRADTLAAFDRALAATGGRVPQRDDLNPPLWELGHIGWFQAWWLARNPLWRQGWRADPDAARPPNAGDALYDSSRVPHSTRWALPLPDADASRAALGEQLDQTLAMLKTAAAQPPAAQRGQSQPIAGGDGDQHGTQRGNPRGAHRCNPRGNPRGNPRDDNPDDALYFFRLALLHEDMHHEAALYTAQALGWPVGDARWQPRPLPDPQPALAFAPGPWGLGQPQPGFQFDNERGPHTVTLPAVQIDTQVLRWADYLPFVEAGAGPVPRYLRRAGTGWQVWRWGRWLALDRALPACHLTWHEANAWCAWAGRRLPTEAEWERAAITRPDAFDWGAVWEWTASPFAAYPAFEPHPYRDYSAPWFGGSHRVLRGASFLTQPRMHHPRYRNFFMPDRSDIAVGFRSCSL